MAKSKEQKRREALARLTANVAERMSEGRQPTFDQRTAYNNLKRSLREDGRI